MPFRPETDTVPAKTFINNFYKGNREGSKNYTGSSLRRELVLTDPAVSLFGLVAPTLADMITDLVQYSQMVLESHAWGSGNLASLPWLLFGRTRFVLSTRSGAAQAANSGQIRTWQETPSTHSSL